MNASIVLYALMLFLVIWSIGKQKNLNAYLKKLGFAKTNLLKESKNTLILLALMYLATIIIGMVFYAYGYQEDLGMVSEIIAQFDLVEVLIIMTMASFVEEIFFRGYIQRKTNVWVASFLFGYFHIIYGSLSEIVGAFFLGVILGKGYEKSKNLFSPILAHFIYNLLTIVLIFSVGVA